MRTLRDLIPFRAVKNFKTLRQTVLSAWISMRYGALNSMKWIKANSRRILRQHNHICFRQLDTNALKSQKNEGVIKMDLLDAIRQFKTRRQKQAEPMVSCPAEAEFSGLVNSYRAIRGMAGGPELEKLKEDFESRWDKLAEDKREIFVQKLLEMQLLPEIIGKALNMFKGKMIRLV